MSYPAMPHHSCPHCGERFFTPYALAAHRAQKHHEAPGEREEKAARVKRHVELAKESRIRNETPAWTKP